MTKRILIAIAATLISASASFASTVTGTFAVSAFHAEGLSKAQSTASMDAALEAMFNGAATASFTYTGALDFGTFDDKDTTSIAGWLATGTPGGVTGLDADFGKRQLSKPNIDTGTATTTFLHFALTYPSLLPGDFTITHDDGVAVYEDISRIGGFEGPNGVRTTEVTGYGGGALEFLYVATNGDPSVLKVEHIVATPLPASAWLMLAGVGGIAAMRRRKRAA